MKCAIKPCKYSKVECKSNYNIMGVNATGRNGIVFRRTNNCFMVINTCFLNNLKAAIIKFAAV